MFERPPDSWYPWVTTSGRPMRHQISKKERALLTIAGAQRMAGPGKTPSARQVRKAHVEAGCAVAKHGIVVQGGAGVSDRMFDKVCTKLSGIGGETDAECGSFWDKIKSAYLKAAPLLPLAAVASPFAAMALMQKGNKGAPAAPAAPADSQSSQADDGTQEVTGFEVISHPAKGYTYLFGDDDLFGDEFGAEDRMLLREGAGTSEYLSARRRQGRVPVVAPFPIMAGLRSRTRIAATDVIPHELYRAAIMKRAQTLGSGSPSAKNMADAQVAVDQQMRAYGLRVGIPGARPGRVTR